MATTKASSALLGSIDDAIAQLEQEAQSLSAAPAPATQRSGASAAGTVAAAPTVDDLALTLSRLKQIKDWFQHDERLLPILDSYIGQQVKASEKRTNAYNLWIGLAFTVVGAILGVLVSDFQNILTWLHL